MSAARAQLHDQEKVPVVLHSRFHLKECICQLVLESHLPHKIVNLWFTFIKVDNFVGGVTFK